MGEAAAVVYNSTNLPTSAGLSITFDAYQYGGTGADGISFDLAVGNPQPATIGQTGGPLGYSTDGNAQGLPGGWLGIGFDVYGNFSNNQYDGTGCTDTSAFTPNAIAVRGPGNGLVGYCVLSSSGDLNAGGTGYHLEGTSRSDAKRAVHITIDPAAGAHGTYTVAVDPTGGTNYVTVTSGDLPTFYYDPTTGNQVTNQLPKRITFALAASTGSFTDVHEITNLQASTLNPVPVLALSATDDTVSGAPPRGTQFNYTLTPGVAPGADEAMPTTLTVTDPLPSGIFASIPLTEPASWDCSKSTVTSISCVYTDPAPITGGTTGTTLPPITVPVSVDLSAGFGTTVTNTATVLSDDAATPVSASDPVTIAPAGVDGLVLTPTLGQPASAVTATFSLDAHLPGEEGCPGNSTGPVTFTWDAGHTDSQVWGTANFDQVTCSATLVKPPPASFGGGTYHVQATYPSSARTTYTDTRVFNLVAPVATLDPISGPANTRVSATFTLPDVGVALCPVDDSVNFSWDGMALPTGIIGLSDSGDSPLCIATIGPFLAPSGLRSPGPHTITAIDPANALSAVTTFTITTPTLQLSPTSGPANTEITATFDLPGALSCATEPADPLALTWDAGAGGSNLHWADTHLIGGASGGCGALIDPKPPAGSTPGTYTISANDRICGCTAQATFTILAPILQVSPTSGPANTEIVATFSQPGATACPADPLALTWSSGATSTTWATATLATTAGGGCGAVIDPQPPAGSVPGTYTISAVDAACGCSAQTSFTIPKPAVTAAAPLIVIAPSGPTTGLPNPTPPSAPPTPLASGVLGVTTPPSPSPQPSASPTPGRAPATSSGTGDAPPLSIFGTSLSLPNIAFGSALQMMATLGIILLLIIFIPFPAELFNSTYEENQDRIKHWWVTHAAWLVAAYAFLKDEEGRRGRALSLVLVIFLGGVLGAGLDPGFGWNLHTLSLGGSVALALILCAAASGVSTYIFRRRRGETTTWRLRALPGGLAITAIGVLISRLTNYEPGYLYGLILVASFVGLGSPRDEGREVAISSSVLIAFSVAAWAVWIPVQSAAAHPGASGALIFLQDLLAAVFVIGIVRSVILLVPMRFLPGMKLVRWNRVAWAVIFGIGAFALAEIMLLPESGKFLRSAAPLVTTLALFAGFGLTSLAFWAYFRYRRPPAGIAQHHG